MAINSKLYFNPPVESVIDACRKVSELHNENHIDAETAIVMLGALAAVNRIQKEQRDKDITNLVPIITFTAAFLILLLRAILIK